jgi:hypothetical protein
MKAKVMKVTAASLQLQAEKAAGASAPCSDCLALLRRLRLHLEPHQYLVETGRAKGLRFYQCLVCMSKLSTQGKVPNLGWTLSPREG